MVKQLRLAAVFLIVTATIALMTARVWAFSQQTVLPNGNYDFNYGALDNDKAKLSDSVKKSDPNSPGLHFSIQGGQTDAFGFHSLGGPGFGGNHNAGPPDYYQPLGRGD
jgi:hypothetical protein